MEAMLTMRPYFCCSIAGTAALQQMNGPSRLMRSTLRHSSKSVSHTVLLTPAMPALLTRMSILPSAFSVSSRVFSTAARSDTSTLKADTAGPISLAVFSANGRSWSQIATLAPEATKRSVIARPKPCAPPVTTAQRPFRSIVFIAFSNFRVEVSQSLSFRDASPSSGLESTLRIAVIDSVMRNCASGLAWRAPGMTLQCPAAVDDVSDAGREGALIAGEINREGRYFFSRAEPAHRLAAHEHLATLRSGRGGAVQHGWGLDRTGANAVAANALGNEVRGNRAGQGRDCCLGRAVDITVGGSLENAGSRGDVHDRAASGFEHSRQKRPERPVHRFHVEV